MTSVSMTITPDSRKPKPWWYLFCSSCHWRLAKDMKGFSSFSSSTHKKMQQHYICLTCHKRHSDEVDAMLWRTNREWVEPLLFERIDQGKT